MIDQPISLNQIAWINKRISFARMSEHFSCCPSIYEHTPYSSLSHRNTYLSTLPHVSHPLSPNTSHPSTLHTFTTPLNDMTNFTLGPPDLVHILKCNDSGEKCIYCYHYVIGVDVSSSASIAVYINSLINDSNCNPVNTKNKSIKTNKNKWKVREVLYCTWNPFTGSDVRVEAKIPGGVRAFSYTNKGAETIENEQWIGVQVAGVLRCVEYGRRGERGLRMVKVDLKEELLQISAIRNVIVGSKDWQGTEVQGIDNYMTDAVLTHCTLQQITNYVSQEHTTNNLLLAKALIKADQVSQGIHLLCDEIVKMQNGGEILAAHLTAQLDMLPGNIELARNAVRNAPLQAIVWINLARAFIMNKQFEQALIALNSCPAHGLTTDNDEIGIVLTEHVYINTKEENDLVLDASSPLQLLRAPFILRNDKVRRIYTMLVEMVSELGWDTFLDLRDSIFLTLRDKTGSTIKATIPRRKVLCETWLEQLLQLLYTDLKAHAMYHSELDISIENNIPMKRSDGEWNVIGNLCYRMGDWNGSKDAWNRIIFHDQQDGSGGTFCFNEKVIRKLAELYKEAGQLGHLLISIDKLILYYNEINTAHPHCIKEWIVDVRRRFGVNALKDAMHVLSSSLSEQGKAEIQDLFVQEVQ